MPPVESRKRNSILGSIALLLAPAALALNYFDFSGLPNVNVGPFEMKFTMAATIAIATLAVLSFLLASQSRRTGTEIPFAAILVSAAALAAGYFHRAVPKTLPPPAPTTSTPAAINSAPARRSAANTRPKPPSLPNAANVGSQARSLANTSSDAVLRQRNLVELRDARAKFDAARAAVIKSLESDPAYIAAKSESDSTLEELKKARAAYPPGNPTLAAASQTALAAHDKLQSLIDSASEKDPTARQAKDRLETAQSAMKRPTGGTP
jgi:hypothetical protein